MLAIRVPFGTSSSPHANRAPSSPPRAAYSHSASVGSDLPAHVAYASASSYATCTTGCRSLPLIVLPGPAGFFQYAPGTYSHQLRTSFSSTGPRRLAEHERPGHEQLGIGVRVVGRVERRSATVV